MTNIIFYSYEKFLYYHNKILYMDKKLFQWQKEFVLNNKLLDKQHEKFVAIVNELSMAIESQCSADIHHVFFLLVNYVEDYLIDTNIKLLECNNIKYVNLKKKQNELLDKVKEFYGKFNFEKATCYGLYSFLVEWFMDYIEMYKKEGYAGCL